MDVTETTCPSCGKTRTLAGSRLKERKCRSCAYTGHAAYPAQQEAVRVANRRRTGNVVYLSPAGRAVLVEKARQLGRAQRGVKRGRAMRAKTSENMRQRHAEGKIPHDTPAQQAAMKKLRDVRKFRDTKPELAAVALLDALGADYKREVWIGRNRVDFLLADGTVVEVFGCWWHGCPCKNPNGYGWRQRDAKRIADLERQGHEVVVLWEHDLV